MWLWRSGWLFSLGPPRLDLFNNNWSSTGFSSSTTVSSSSGNQTFRQLLLCTLSKSDGVDPVLNGSQLRPCCDFAITGQPLFHHPRSAVDSNNLHVIAQS